MKIGGILFFVLISKGLVGQVFYFGNDLSYANQMEDCGAVFKENGTPKDVYEIFADHGTNLVRLRLWVDPSWQNELVQPDGVKPQYSDFEDVSEAIRRSRNAGMQVMLEFQLSDVWADPGRQLIPVRWLGVANDLTALKDSVYNYITSVLTELEKDTLMPEIVKIGNENNGGILRHTTMDENWVAGGSVSSSWSRHAELFNAAIKAVRDLSQNTTIKPKIALHQSGLSSLSWFYQNIISNGVTDFDIMGLSYYYSWHGSSIQALGNAIRSLKSSYPAYDVMVIETGYLWTQQNFDQFANIINTPDPAYLPVIPEKQLEYMVDYTREVIKAGGIGLVFWEPDWVSTPCRTPWGQGSAQEHVAFFDPVNTNFMENGGGRWTESEFYQNINDKKVVFKVDMTGQDVSNGVFIAGSWTGDTSKILPMANLGSSIYSYFGYLSPGDSGLYHFINGNDLAKRETVPTECRAWSSSDRGYQVPDHDVTYFYGWSLCEAVSPPPPKITFKVDMTGQDVSRGVFIVGEINDWKITSMTIQGNGIYSWSATLTPGDDTLAFYYLTTGTWTNYLNFRETVPAECALRWGSDRGIVIPDHDTIVAVRWGSCETITDIEELLLLKNKDLIVQVFPNPTNGLVHFNYQSGEKWIYLDIIDTRGRILKSFRLNPNENTCTMDLQFLAPEVYLLRFNDGKNLAFCKIICIK